MCYPGDWISVLWIFCLRLESWAVILVVLCIRLFPYLGVMLELYYSIGVIDSINHL